MDRPAAPPARSRPGRARPKTLAQSCDYDLADSGVAMPNDLVAIYLLKQGVRSKNA